MSIFRVYLYNLTTRKEMVEHPDNGKTWLATSGMVKDEHGKYIPDTCSSVEVAAYADLRTVKGRRVLTAADFPHPVAIKVWYGPKAGHEWRKLVPERVPA